MTQKQKELLLRDLCARLPYRPKIQFTESNYNDCLQSIWYDNLEGWQVDGDKLSAPIYAVKPYLFPLSSMTEEQRIEYDYLHSIIFSCFEDSLCEAIAKLYDWCNKNHIDYRGLITMGLAEDATGLNIY